MYGGRVKEEAEAWLFQHLRSNKTGLDDLIMQLQVRSQKEARRAAQRCSAGVWHSTLHCGLGDHPELQTVSPGVTHWICIACRVTKGGMLKGASLDRG